MYKYFESLAKKVYPSKEPDMYAHPSEVADYENSELGQTMKRYNFVEGNYYGFCVGVIVGVIIGAALCGAMFLFF